MGRAERGFIAAHGGAQARGVARRQQGQVLRADLACTGQYRGIRRFRQLFQVRVAQLQQQAFRHVARADAWGIEGLEQRQGRLQLIQVRLQFRRQPVQDFLQRRSQVPVLVQFVDQEAGQRDVPRGGPRQPQLAQQMLAQRVGARGLGPAGVLVGIDAAGTRHLIHWRLALSGGFVVLHGGFAVGFRWRLGRRRFVLALQQRVLRQHLRDLGFEVERGQLQQSDRLLQLWRQRQMLTRSQF